MSNGKAAKNRAQAAPKIFCDGRVS